MIELSTLATSRKSCIEIEIPNHDETSTIEKLHFEYKPISPLVLRELDKISSEVKNSNKENEGTKNYESRSVLIEQLVFLLTALDIAENGKPIEINIAGLEKINLDILEEINAKIYLDRLPTKKTSSTSNDGMSPVEKSEESLIG